MRIPRIMIMLSHPVIPFSGRNFYLMIFRECYQITCSNINYCLCHFLYIAWFIFFFLPLHFFLFCFPFFFSRKLRYISCSIFYPLYPFAAVTFSRMDPEGKLVMGFRKASNSIPVQVGNLMNISNSYICIHTLGKQSEFSC